MHSDQGVAGGAGSVLEPPGLLAAFEQHPPEGFAPWPAAAQALGAPVFVAPFDLLTTAEPGLRQRLARWPLARWWLRWLTLPTTFVGTTVTEYLPLPPAGSETAFAAALRGATGRRCALTIAKDIPQASPLLGAEANARADRLAEACRAAGCLLLDGQALAWVPIDFASTADYLARLSPSRRKNLKRKLKARDGLQIDTVRTGAAFDDPARTDAYYALYEAVYAQSEVHFDKLTRAHFRQVLRDAGNGGVAFEYRRASDGLLVGWNLCFEHGGMLLDKTIGLRYPEAREMNLYFVSWFVNLEHALARGLTHYVAGWTDPEVKAQLGAQFTFTRHAVWVRNPLLRRLAGRFAHHFESDRAWRDQHEGAAP